MTLPEFAGMYSTLCVQLRHMDVDAVSVRAYYRVLQDLEVEFVAMAATQFAAAAEWFPKSSEWRKLARKIEHERTVELQARLRKLPTSLCEACEDTGWRPYHNSNPPRFIACDCRLDRRLEVLGRRPWPQLPPAVDEPDGALDPRVEAAVQTMATRKGM